MTFGPGAGIQAQESPETLLLKDYRPKSIYKIPKTEVQKAKYPVIDVHSHAYARTPEQVAEWVRVMDQVGVEKTVVLSGAVGPAFDAICQRFAPYPNRFEVWCGLDLRNSDQPGFSEAAVKELERCARAGARGVGEIIDKGSGLSASAGGTRVLGPHPDDPRMDAIFRKCAELRLPVSLHVADPIWMYEPMDKNNDGLMNALRWRLDNKPGIVGHAGMIEILERTVRKHSKTTFIACHFANLDYDLTRMGELLGRNPNLYADISARYAETAPIPRFAARFYEKFAGRLLYGTDMGFNSPMYRITFRILETPDEHFYEIEQFGYHWSLNGFGLPDAVLKKVYRDNALQVLKRR
ncbi:MAG: amidohydrolase family protein [Acidobacteria bacterium]|nr:amidohydrolase family protein [Acidobacteriota bacterium]